MAKHIEVYQDRTVEQSNCLVEHAISYGFLIHGGSFGEKHFSALMEHGLLPIAELGKIGIHKYSAYNNPHDICTTMLPNQPTAFNRLSGSGNAEVYALRLELLMGLQMAIVINPEKLPSEYRITPVGEFPKEDYPDDSLGRITIDHHLRNRNDFWWYAETHIKVVNEQQDVKGVPISSWTGVIVSERDFVPKFLKWFDALPPHLQLLDTERAVHLPATSTIQKPLVFVPTRQA